MSKYIEGVIDLLDRLQGNETSSPRSAGIVDIDHLVPPGRRKEGGISPTSARRLSESLKSGWPAFPHYDECIAAFQSSDLYRKELGHAIEKDVIDDTEDYEELVKNDTLPRILSKYLGVSQKLIFDESTFKNVYFNFEEYLESDSIEYVSLGILRNLTWRKMSWNFPMISK